MMRLKTLYQIILNIVQVTKLLIILILHKIAIPRSSPKIACTRAIKNILPKLCTKNAHQL